MKIGFIHILGSLIGIAVLTYCSSPNNKEKGKPNILLIYAEGINFDEIGVNSNTISSTPNIDQLTKYGVNFTNAYSASHSSSEAAYSLFTGSYYKEEGEVDFKKNTIIDIFKKGGYKTIHIGKKNFFTLNPLLKDYGEDFDFIYSWNYTAEIPILLENHLKQAKESFFIFISIDSVSSNQKKSNYVREIDTCVAGIRAILSEKEIENTLILFTSTSKTASEEAFRKPNEIPRASLLKIPFIVNWNNQISPLSSHALISPIDLLSSFAQLLNVNLEPSVNTSSQELLNTLAGTDYKGRKSLFIPNSEGYYSLITPEWHYVSSGSHNGNQYLFNLIGDPEETNNCIITYPDISSELQNEAAIIRNNL